jgi:hypothetical protein
MAMDLSFNEDFNERLWQRTRDTGIDLQDKIENMDGVQDDLLDFSHNTTWNEDIHFRTHRKNHGANPVY